MRSSTAWSPPVPTDQLLDGSFVRDGSYTVPVLVRLTDDVVPAELRLFWERPAYVSVPLEVAGAG